jgi:hypothetical protein
MNTKNQTDKKASETPVSIRIERAFLVYQAGIANVFAVDCHNLAPFGRNARRLLQHAFRPCEDFARGLAAAGVIVRTAACNEAGDISESKWSEDLDAQPFSDNFNPVHENNLTISEKEEFASLGI